VPGRDHIGILDPTSLHIKPLEPIGVQDVAYRALALGPRTGDIYLFGNRIIGPDRGPRQGPPSDAVVTVLDSTNLTVIHNWTVRPSAGLDWYVYSGSIDDQEHHLYVSYHGPPRQLA